MKLTPHQEAFYDAVTGLDAKFVEEAAQPAKLLYMPTVKRLAAAAAMIAILLSCLIFPWEILNRMPILSFTVSAADMENNAAKITIESSIVDPYVANINHPRVFLPEEWHYKDLFCIKIKMENFNVEYSNRVFTEIEYNGQIYTQSANDDNLAFQFPENKHVQFTHKTFCTVYGWTDDALNFTVTVYHQFNDEKTVLLTHSFDIVQKNNYVINGKNLTLNVDPALYFKTTDQIIDDIIVTEELPMLGLSSSAFGNRQYIFSHYSEEINVLYQRKNAKDAIIRKIYMLMIKGVALGDMNASQINALIDILTAEVFLEQLTDWDIYVLRLLFSDGDHFFLDDYMK